MVYVKGAIVTILVLIGVLIGYMFVAFDADHELHLATEAFLKGQYEEAGKDLSKLDGGHNQEQIELYEAYVARALNKMEQSQKLLDSAAALAKQHHQPELQLEIRLNQAMNAYLMHDNEALKNAVEAAAQEYPNQPWTVFFQGLLNYQMGNFAKAADLWSITSEKVPLSAWMKKAFDVVFTKQWMILSLARCQLEEGKYLMARQTLEEEAEHASDPDAVNFLIGLTYVKEAAGKSPSTSVPYWKLAFSYLNRVPIMNDRYSEERQRLIAAVQKIAQGLLVSNSYQDLPFYAAMLQAWGADKGLNEMNDTVIASLNQAVTDGNWRRVEELAAVANRVIPDGEVRRALQKRFLNMATGSLDRSLIEPVTEYWSVAHLLSAQPEKESQAFAALVAAKALSLIPDDDSKLSISMPYINLWASIEKNNAARLIFAKELLDMAEKAWLSPDGSARAEQLLKVASNIPQKDDQAAFAKARSDAIVQVYEEITKRDDGDKLPSILDAVDLYRVTEVDIKSPEQLSRNLASAQQFLRQQRYEEALKRAEWVLRLDPNNQGAAVVAGMALYHQAHYVRAKEYLSKQSSLPSDGQEALAISQLLTGDEGVGSDALHRIQRDRTLSNDVLLRLSLGLLIENKPEEALTWLKQVNRDSPEITIARAYAYYLMKQYDKVTPLLGKIAAPYSALDGVNGLAIQSDLASGNVDASEKALIKLLNQPASPPVSGMSAPFQSFDSEKFAEFGRYYLAGLFFKNIKKKNDIAVKYFRLVNHPTPAMAVEIGEVLLAQKQIDDAIQLLSSAVQQDKDMRAAADAMPILAKALEAKQNDIAAYQWYLKFYDHDPKTTRYRGDYARLLEKLRRFDIALQQYTTLGDWKKFSSEDTVGYAKALFHLGRWDEVSAVGESLFQRQPAPSLVDQLRMARILVSVENYKSTWPLLRSLPPVDKLSTDEVEELIQFLAEIGAYNQAGSTASQKHEQLEASVEGLLVLAKLNEQLSRYTDALTYARLARALAPNNLDVYAAVGRYARDEGLLESLVSELEKKSDSDPSNLSLRLAFARELAELGNWVAVTDDKGASRYLSDYQKAYFLLQKAVSYRGDLPEIRMVMGQLLGLLNNSKESIAAYRAALQLDPSYADAYIGLANEYRGINDNKAAIKALYQAVQFAPDRADAWLRLAELSKDKGDLYEASQFYQNALKHNPNNLRIYLALGKVLLDLRNPEDAKVLMVRAVELAPKNTAILQLAFQVLVDPLLKASSDDPRALVKEQQLVYNQLHSVDAAAAEKFLSEIRQRQRSSDQGLPGFDDDAFPIQK